VTSRRGFRHGRIARVASRLLAPTLIVHHRTAWGYKEPCGCSMRLDQHGWIALGVRTSLRSQSGGGCRRFRVMCCSPSVDLPATQDPPQPPRKLLLWLRSSPRTAYRSPSMALAEAVIATTKRSSTLRHSHVTSSWLVDMWQAQILLSRQCSSLSGKELHGIRSLV